MSPVKFSLDRSKIWAEIIGITLGGAFAFWKFVYEDHIVPSRYPPVLTTRCVLTKLSETDSLVWVQLDLSVKNNSHRRIYILQADYRVALQTYFHTAPIESWLDFNTLIDTTLYAQIDSSDGDIIRDLEYESVGVLAATFGSFTELDENDEETMSYTYPVMKRDAQVVHVDFSVMYSKYAPPESCSRKQFMDADMNILTYYSPDSSGIQRPMLQLAAIDSVLLNELQVVVSSNQAEIVLECCD